MRVYRDDPLIAANITGRSGVCHGALSRVLGMAFRGTWFPGSLRRQAEPAREPVKPMIECIPIPPMHRPIIGLDRIDPISGKSSRYDAGVAVCLTLRLNTNINHGSIQKLC